MSTIRIEVLGQTFETALPTRPVVVGRGAGVDLALDCEGVAATHCTFDVLPDGRHRVKDGGSGRETRVNGVAVKQISLKAGDVIEVGAARIMFLGGPPAVAQVPAAPAIPDAVPAKPVAVSAKPVPVPVKPQAAPAKPKPAPATAETGQAEVSRPAAQEAGSDERIPARTRNNKPKSKLVMPLVAVALLGVLAVALAKFVDSDKAAQQGAAQRQFEDGRRLLDAKDFERARKIFTALAENPGAGDYSRKARVRLDFIRKTEAQLEADLSDLKARGLNLTAGALLANRESFVADYGEGNAGRYDELKNAILQDHAHWRGDAVEIQRMETKVLLDRRQFGAALEGWRSFGASAPPAVDLTTEVQAGTDEVQLAASRAADGALGKARKLAKRSGPRQARRYLDEQASGFEGTKAEIRIRSQIRDLRKAEAAAAALARPTEPVSVPPTRGLPESGQPEAGQPAPGTVPATPTEPAHETLAKAALEAAGADIQAYRFAEAATQIDKALATLPAGEWRDRLGHWKQDLTLADASFGRLVADIPANPKRYRGIKIGDRMRVSFVDADRETIATLVRGGKSRMKWSRVAPQLMAEVIGRLPLEGAAGIEAAALLHLIGGAEQRDAIAFQAGQSGASTDALFPLLARWRGEDLPAGGYVTYAERYVTPERREFLVLEAKIAAALAKVHDDDAAERAKAYATLLAIGEPAEARFVAALESRRLQLADQIATSKAFRSGKTKKKLFEVLKQRRRTALALINDAAAYPYPNPGKKNQKRVEQLVDLVREIWERPFDPITQWNKKLKDELLVVTEVDEVLVQLDPEYEPDLDIIKVRINEAINMPAFTPDGQSKGLREYSLKVLDFNNKLDTTATAQEKDNTLIVNEYRMMMGLRAVKINERLLRASRGHSRHMRENKYFAHNVPAQFATEKNVSPGVRARTQGYGGGTGENIAMGMGTGRGAFWAWFGSSGHHRNMVNAGWTEMGCGRSGRYWTQLFGAAGGTSLTAPAKLPDPEPAFAPESEGPTTPARRGPNLPDARGGNGGGLFEGD